MITRLVPIGADLDTGTSDVDTGQYTSRQRVTIESVNGVVIAHFKEVLWQHRV